MTYKSKLLSAICALPLMAGATAATAGGFETANETPVVVPAPVAVIAPSADWTGFYVGGQLGYGMLNSDALDDDTSGAVYGVHAGYLYDLGSVVLGAEVDYDKTAIESSVPADGVTLDSIARAKLRVGYDAGAWMPYATIGAVQASTSGAVEGDGNGAFAGLGVDYQIGDNWRVGGEILQHKFEDFADNDGLNIDATTATLRASMQF